MVRFTRTPGNFIVAPNAFVVGDVEIAQDCSFWFGAVVRGDVATVRLGKRVNVQDNAVIHCDSGVSNVIGDDVTIGHSAVVHGESIGRGTLIGMRATVLGKTQIGEECLIAAGAVLSPGMVVPDRMVVMGVPGKIARPVRDEELKYMRWLTGHYVALAMKYADEGFANVAASGPSPLGEVQ